MTTIFDQNLKKAINRETTEYNWKIEFDEHTFDFILETLQNRNALTREKNGDFSKDFLSWWCARLPIGHLLTVALTAMTWYERGDGAGIERFCEHIEEQAISQLQEKMKSMTARQQLTFMREVIRHPHPDEEDKVHRLQDMSFVTKWPPGTDALAKWFGETDDVNNMHVDLYEAAKELVTLALEKTS